MSTYRQMIYLVLDELKLSSDDSQFTEQHVLFLLNKYRALILKQRYSDIRKEISESNYQTVCLKVSEVPAIPGLPCEGGSYLRSEDKLSTLMNIGNPMVYPLDYFQGSITYISRERMRYVGHNKYLKSIIYASLGTDSHLYLTSSNPQFLYLENVKVTGVFEDTIAASEIQCMGNKECDILDRTFPLEDPLITTVIGLVVKDLGGVLYNPEDTINNDQDDLSKVKINNGR